MKPWLPWGAALVHFEQQLVLKLLRSPSFHRGVQSIHKRLHRLQHGTPPEELGGTKVDVPKHGRPQRLLQLFWEELKNGHQTRPKNK